MSVATAAPKPMPMQPKQAAYEGHVSHHMQLLSSSPPDSPAMMMCAHPSTAAAHIFSREAETKGAPSQEGAYHRAKRQGSHRMSTHRRTAIQGKRLAEMFGTADSAVKKSRTANL